MRLDNEDLQVLFLSALYVREKQLTMSTPASVADAIDQCFKGKKVRGKAMRRRIKHLVDQLRKFVAPVAPLRPTPLPAVIDNLRTDHFAEFGIDIEGVQRLHAAGRGLDLADMSADDISTMLSEDRGDVLESGCSHPGCVYHGAPWRPWDGMRSPYGTARGEKVLLCLHHGQDELFAMR